MKKAILLILIITLTGCFNYQELNNLAIVTTIAIDKYNDELEVSLAITNSKNEKSHVLIYSSHAKTISEAIKNIDLVIPKNIYLGHLSTVVINEDVAKEGTRNIINYFLNLKNSSKSFYLAVAKGNSAKDIMNVKLKKENEQVENIESNILIPNKALAISTTTYSDFTKKLLKPGIEPSLTVITLDKNNNIKLNELALFKSDKLVSFATEKQSIGINLITNKINEILIPIRCKNNSDIIKLSNINSKIKVNKSISIIIKTNASMQEVNCQSTNIQKEIKKEVKNLIKKGINIAKDNETDIFGFENLIYKRNPKHFNKNSWNKNEFTKINPDIKIQIDFDKEGDIF